MKTQNINTESMSTELVKALALKQHLGEPFFIVNDRAFEGDEGSALESYEFCKEDHETFEDFLISEAVEVEEYNEDDYSNDYSNDYLVLTDEEADEKAKEYILDSVWAFNASFLAGETGIDQEVFEAIQANDRCESNNEAILRLIKDEDGFVKSAISSDGRGHFMSSYDGNENKVTIDDQTFYIYRIN